MIHESIELFAERPEVRLVTYVTEQHPEIKYHNRTAVLVLPGGGYSMTSQREAEVIAKSFFAAGMNAFVLYYSVGAQATEYRPLLDASKAVVTIRENAEKWDIDPQKIVVCGFSAGGHLAASLGTLWHLDVLSGTLGFDEGANRPNGMILCYPVISGREYGHRWSIQQITGSENPTEEQLDFWSLDRRVDGRTCPAFLWHTAEDGTVPVESSLRMASALSAHKIPFELHIFPYGAHGLSTAAPESAPDKAMVMPYVSRWIGWAIEWVSTQLFPG